MAHRCRPQSETSPHTPPRLSSANMAGMSLLRSAAAVFSRLQAAQRGVLRGDALLRRAPLPATVPLRFSSSHGKKLFVIGPTVYHDKKFLSYLKFYVLLGVIPAAIAITLINIFIGPAELAEIPEGYVPEEWEYYQHPITRWISRNMYPTFQESYEKGMAIIHIESEKRQLRLYEDIAERAMERRGDGPWFFHTTVDKNLIDNEHKATPDQ
ncbi:NADH dehydrogenase [ubiquinone] 1 beta subcomplex subunit 5, mitochondrial [Hyperolius riggenbachi]|uniref:NADH dehydrogenase [ubiquinone] 1 beta subcomplex subunit 5, mitochondrial n=1 Tax=Hyperolius riggenbachi TaxID=752182 RepID=UPI0035A33FEA